MSEDTEGMSGYDAGQRAPAVDVAALLAEHGKAQATIEVRIPQGVLTFRRMASADDIFRLENAATRFATAWTKHPPAGFDAIRPATEATAKMAYYIAHLSVEPTFTEHQALELCQVAGPLAARIYSEIMEQAGMLAAKVEEEAIDALGEASSEAGSSPST